MRSAGDSTGVLSKGLGGVKTAVGLLGGAFAAVKVGGFFKDAIMGASNMEETLSKVGVVFGQMADQVKADAKFMADSFGIPKQQFLDASASIGLIGKASGIAEKDLGEFSTNMARLATDASSFYNVPLEEALTAIQSGLVGEAEPMRRFGVLLSAAAVEAKAAEMGLETYNGELTEGAKAQARAVLIMEGMKDATGDLERTQGSLSNRLRELKGRFSNFTTELGSKAIPFVLKLMDSFESLGGRLGPVFSKIGEGVKLFTNAFRTGMTEDEGTPIESIALKIREVVTGVVGFVQTNWPRIKEIITEAMTTVQSVISNVVTIVMTIWNNFGSQIVAVLRSAWDFVTDIVDAAMNIIRGVIQVVTGLIQGDWSAVWEGIKSIFSGVWDAIKAIVSTAIDIVKQVISAGWEIVRGIFVGAWNGIVDAVRGGIGWMLDEIRSIPGRILSALGDLGSLLFNAGRRLLTGFIDGIKSMIGAIADTLGGITSKLTSWKGPPARDAKLLFGTGQLVMGGFIGGLESRYGDVRSSLAGVTKSLGVTPGISVSGGQAAAAATHASGGSRGGTQVIQLVVDGKVLAQVVREEMQHRGTQVGEGNLFRNFGSAA